MEDIYQKISVLATQRSLQWSAGPCLSLVPEQRASVDGYIYTQLIHIVEQQKLTHCKVIILQLKKKKERKVIVLLLFLVAC